MATQLGSSLRAVSNDKRLCRWSRPYLPTSNLTIRYTSTPVDRSTHSSDSWHVCCPGIQDWATHRITSCRIEGKPNPGYLSNTCWGFWFTWIDGCVIANDLDVKRCYLLTHIVQQLGSPSFMVTNYNAQFFPSLLQSGLYLHQHSELLWTPEAGTPVSVTTLLPRVDGTPFLFDRIICDVPCSGDGTIRKQPNIANKWSYKNGMTFHAVQLSIASRGFELLKPGGIMVHVTPYFRLISCRCIPRAP